MLSTKAIDEFTLISKKEFGEDISDDLASDHGTELLEKMRVIYRPIPKGKLKNDSQTKIEVAKDHD